MRDAVAVIDRSGIEPPALLGIDLGTQTTRVLAFDVRGQHLCTASRPTPVDSQGEGRAEYDPEALWETVEACLAAIVASLPSGMPVAGIAVASVGEACVLVDPAGRATTRALVWFDRRTEAAARAIEARLGRDRLFAITGQYAEPSFGLCKLLWMRENWPDGFARAARVLNIADWIAFRLCGVAATDFSLASRMLALDIHARQWSVEILGAFDIARGLHAPLAASGTALGPMRTALAHTLGFARPPLVAVGGHDHLCGMFAAGAARPGVLLDSLGTAEAVLRATPRPLDDRAILDRGYIQGCIEADEPLAYVGAGLNASGGAVEWFRTELAGGAQRGALIHEAAAVAPGAGGVVFLPHLAYAPAPNPDAEARGAFVGLTRDANRASLFRAVLEGLAFEARQIIDGMIGIGGLSRPDEIRVVGGHSRNSLFLTIKASVLGRPLTVIDEPEATALGAAILGGLGAGVWKDLGHALASIEQPRHQVAPVPQWQELYDRIYSSTYRRLYPALREINGEIAAWSAS
jgi:xylulokinase